MPDAHTPAPWYDDGYRIYAPTDDVDKRNGRIIVEYKHVDYFNHADAPLMTAAPALLEALRECVGALGDIWEQLHDMPSSPDEVWPDASSSAGTAFDMAEKAIVQATGIDRS